MATKKQALATVAKFGGTVESDPRFSQAEAFAPRGCLWASNQCSTYPVRYGYSGHMASAWDEIIEGVSDGLIPAPGDYEGAWWEE